MRKLILTAALALSPLAPAAAALPITEQMTCPIGGASFAFTTTAAYSTTGERPDGKPYGSWRFPTPLPECPDNGLILYKDYTPEEVARLEPLVASEAYQALRAETQYYRAYWLMKEMGLGPERYLWALLQASWEADGRPELRARYQNELVEASAKVPPAPADLNWIGMEARAINALRELGRFDDALARLDKVSMASLNVTVPAGRADSAPVRAAKQRRAWHAYFAKLRPAIERQDKAAEPFDLIPSEIAVGRCLDNAAGLSEFSSAFCEKESSAVTKLREERARLARESEALRQSRDASGR